MSVSEHIRSMTDDEFEDEFEELLSLVRDTDETTVYVAIEVKSGELQTAWGESKFADATHKIAADPFKSYSDLRRELLD